MSLARKTGFFKVPEMMSRDADFFKHSATALNLDFSRFDQSKAEEPFSYFKAEEHQNLVTEPEVEKPGRHLFNTNTNAKADFYDFDKAVITPTHRSLLDFSKGPAVDHKITKNETT